MKRIRFRQYDIQKFGNWRSLAREVCLATIPNDSAREISYSFLFDPEFEDFKVNYGRSISIEDSTPIVHGAAVIQKAISNGSASERQLVHINMGRIPLGGRAEHEIIGERSEPTFPGEIHFSENFKILESGEILDLTAVIPLDKKITVDCLNLEHTQYEAEGFSVQKWKLSPSFSAERGSVASIYISSFENYKSLGVAIGNIIKKSIYYSSNISSLAKEISGASKNQNEKIYRIYEWVRDNISSNDEKFSIDLLKIVNLDSVISRKNGNATDKLQLFRALINSIGVNSDVILISLNNLITIPVAPVAEIFDHLFCYIPEYKIYVDPMIFTEDLRYLPIEYNNRSTLHISETSTGISSFRPIHNAENVVHQTITATILEDGRIVGSSKTSGSGSAAISLRGIRTRISEQSCRYMARAAMDAAGSVGFGCLQLADSSGCAPAEIVGDFEVYPQPELMRGEPIRMTLGFRLIDNDIFSLLNKSAPDKFKCDASIQYIDDVIISAPLGFNWLNIPNTIKLTTNNICIEIECYKYEKILKYVRTITINHSNANEINDDLIKLKNMINDHEYNDYISLDNIIDSVKSEKFNRACGLNFCGIYNINIFHQTLEKPILSSKVTFGRVDVPNYVEDLYSPGVFRRGEDIYVLHRLFGKALITKENNIIIDPLDGPYSQHTNALLSGPVLTIILCRLGTHSFHASSVALGDRAIAFAGESGRGKSTLTAAFAMSGWRPVADDILAMELPNQGGAYIWPGPRQSWLLPDSLVAFESQISSDNKRRGDGKSYIDYSSSWVTDKIYLSDIILLETLAEGSASSIVRLDEKNAADVLIEHIRLLNVQQDLVGSNSITEYCKSIAARVSVHIFSRPHKFEELNKNISDIERHVGIIRA